MNVPRAQRFAFICNFCEEALIRITDAQPSYLKFIPDTNQTPAIIKSALLKNGWALEYVANQTPEWIELATSQQPLAIKYVKLK